MPTSRTTRHRLTAVVTVAAIGLCANGLTADASGNRHVQSLGSPIATPTAALVDLTPPSCVTPAGCDLYAHSGTVTAGTSGPIDVWGFTFNSAANTGELGGSVNNTIIITEGQTLYLNLHNDLPAGAGDLSLEVPAAQGVPSAGVPVGSAGATVSYANLDPGTYVYEAGATIEQPRQLAMGLAAIIIVRPSDFGTAQSDFGAGAGAFDDEALVVMNELDPNFNAAPLTSDVEDYTPQYFFINGKAHPDTDDIAANPGDHVLLRAANLGIRDRALGLLNLRMNVIGDDSHSIDSNVQASVESKLLTPGQVADVTTIVDPSATVGTQFAVLDLSRHLNNSGEVGVGGALTFIDVVTGLAPAGNSVAKVTGLSPATNDGSAGNDITVDVTFSGGTTSAAWFLDTIDGAGHAFSAADGSAVVTVPIADVLGDGALTGDHVLWIQPYGPAAGAPSGDVFTLSLDGPTVFALTTDPQFANLVFNKTDLNPPGSTDVLLTGSALPSLLDYEIDTAEGCLSLPALPSDPCPPADQVAVTVAGAVGPSHEQALSARIAVADFSAGDGAKTIYVRVHEIPTGAGTDRSSGWGDPNSFVDVVLDTAGPAVTIDPAHTAVSAGAGNNPANLNFLESIRIQVDVTDSLSPILDAELFLDSADADGTGSQLRPSSGEWLDPAFSEGGAPYSRSAYIDIPVSELLSRPQGNVSVLVHAKDAAGNWGPMTTYLLKLDKTNPVVIGTPVDIAASHQYNLVDENGAPVLSGGKISLNACDPNGVTAVGSCPAGVGSPPETNPVSSGIAKIRYHVSAVTGTFGVAGAGVFYQTAQETYGTVTDNGNGTSHVVFDWHLIQPSPVPPDSATSVWVWVLDGAGNPGTPVEVVLGP